MHKYTHKYNLASHIHLSKFLHNKYNELVIADTFRLVALSMISLFVPIFLLEKGFSIEEIIYMELGILFGSIVLHYFVLKVITMWGVKKTLILSYVLNIVLYISMFYVDILVGDFGRYFFLFVIAVLNIIPSALYWSAHHIFFLRTTEVKNEGKKLGILMSIPSFVGIVSPLVGSILIDGYSFQLAFLVSAGLMGVASSVLFFSEDIKVKSEMSVEKIFDIRGMRKNLIFFIQGISHIATGFVWPIFLFFLKVHLISMGFLYLFSNAFYSIVSYLGGKGSDGDKAKKFGKIGAMGHGFSMIFRALFTTIVSMTAFQTMGGIFGGLLHIVLDSKFYKNSHKDMSNAVMNRELYMHLGRIFVVVLFLVLLNFFDTTKTLAYLLIVSGVSTFLLSLIITDDKKGSDLEF
jgi:hypothetical protein